MLGRSLLGCFAFMVGLSLAPACGSSSDDKDDTNASGGNAGEDATGGRATGGRATGGEPTGGSSPTGGRGGTDGRGGAPTGGSSTGGTDGGAPPGGQGGDDDGGGGEPGGGAGGEGGDDATSGRALRFDGVDDYVALPLASDGASETAFSSEAWFKTSAPTGMLLEVAGGSGADRLLYLDQGKVCFYVYTPAYSTLCTTAATFADGTFHHAAGTLGPAGQFLYVDGAVAASAVSVTASAFNGDSTIRAGFGHIGPNGVLTYFAGELDEIRLWSVQRSTAEIAANRNQSLAPSTAGLQGYWPLAESGNAVTTLDVTTGGHDGALVGFSFATSPWVSPGAF